MDNRVKVKNKNLYKMVTLKKTKKKDFQDQLSFNAGQKYCKMLQREHSAILCTFIKLPFVIKIFCFVYFEWPFYTGFTVVKIETLAVPSTAIILWRQQITKVLIKLHRCTGWSEPL